MTSATEPKQFAGPAQQNLPELSAVARVPEPARRDVGRSAAEPVRMAGAGAELVVPFAAAFGLDQRTHGLETLTAGAAPVQIAPDAAGELLPAAILRHVTELRQIGASELAVVLQPDAGTQLTLRLSRDAHGEVLVQARCEQGDAQLLAANWGEIRHSLAQQGVRLGALEFSSDRSPDPLHPHAGNGGPSPDGQPSSQRHGQPWPETLDELPLVGSLTESPARRIVLRPPAGRTRLLESWA